MCEFCIKHGEGRKWYLRAENYSAEMRDKLGSIDTAFKFGTTFDETVAKGERAIQVIKRLPWLVRKVIYAAHAKWQKDMHFGQVIPIEDVDAIFDTVSSIVRLPCLCRRYSIKDEGRYCLGVTGAPVAMKEDRILKRIFYGSFDAQNLEYLNKDEAMNLVRQYDKKGLIHTVWTIKTPYITAVCNCEIGSCTGFKLHNEGYAALFRAEYVAVADPEACIGCRACVNSCPFGALYFNESEKKVFIDPKACYGCGLCRAHCHKNAILLMNRREHIEARNIW